MFIRKIVLLLLSLILISLVLPQSKLSAQGETPSDAPYIYYYSDWLDSFVIECADGSDSRLFGEGVISTEGNSVNGSWSPSGKWFAFTASERLVWGDWNNLGGYVLSVDGTQRIDLNQFKNLEAVYWLEHPSRDLLLIRTVNQITFRDIDDAFGYYLQEYYILDVATGEILVNALATPFDEIPTVATRWFPDEQKFILSYLDYPTRRTMYRIYSLDGSYEEIQPDWLTIMTDTQTISLAGWTLQETFGEDENDYIMRFNILAQQHEQLEIPFPRATYWSPDGKNAFAVIQNEDNNRELWYVGESDILNLSEQFDIDYSWEYPIPQWSPDGHYLLFGDETQLFILPANTGEPLSVDISLKAPEPQWAGYYWYWLSNEEIVVYSHDLDINTVAIYNVTAESEQVYTTTANFYNGPPRFSSDRQYFGSVDDGAIIHNIVEDNYQYFLPNSGGYDSMYGYALQWHDAENWFISREDALIAGGANSLTWETVGKADGSIRRELPFCTSFSCVHWLPAKVDITKLSEGQDTSYLPSYAPTKRIPHGDWIYEVLQWSADGQSLLVDDTIYDINSGEVVERDDIEFVDSPFAFDDIISHNSQYQLIDRRTEDLQPVAIVERDTDSIIFEFADLYYLRSGHFSFDDSLLVVASFPDDRRLYVIGMEERKIVQELYLSATVVAFSPDGSQIAMGVGWEIWIWDVADLLALGE